MSPLTLSQDGSWKTLYSEDHFPWCTRDPSPGVFTVRTLFVDRTKRDDPTPLAPRRKDWSLSRKKCSSPKPISFFLPYRTRVQTQERTGPSGRHPCDDQGNGTTHPGTLRIPASSSYTTTPPASSLSHSSLKLRTRG